MNDQDLAHQVEELTAALEEVEGILRLLLAQQLVSNGLAGSGADALAMVDAGQEDAVAAITADLERRT